MPIHELFLLPWQLRPGDRILFAKGPAQVVRAVRNWSGPLVWVALRGGSVVRFHQDEELTVQREVERES